MSFGSLFYPRKLAARGENVSDEAAELLESASPAPSTAELLNTLNRQAARLTGADGSAIALSEDGGAFVCRASFGEVAPQPGTRVEINTGLSGLCINTASVLTCNDAERDPRVNQDACRIAGIRSIAIVPVGNEPVTGLLEVFSRQPNAFDEKRVKFLQNIARLVRVTSDQR